MNQLKWEGRQQRKNREAEDTAVREKAWGVQGQAPGTAMSDEEVGDTTYLGDITNHTHQQRSMFGTLAGLGLAAAGLGAGAAIPIAAWSHFMGDNQEQVEPVPNVTQDGSQYELRVFKD